VTAIESAEAERTKRMEEHFARNESDHRHLNAHMDTMQTDIKVMAKAQNDFVKGQTETRTRLGMMIGAATLFVSAVLSIVVALLTRGG
jgi:hypothetical protein